MTILLALALLLAVVAPQASPNLAASMDDDRRAVKIAQGYLPETARFTPARGHKVQ